VRARQNFSSVSADVHPSVRFYDAEGARVHDTRLDFAPNFTVKKGQRLRASFGCPGEEVLRRTRRVVLLRPGDKVFPAGLAKKYRPGDGMPAGKIAWDTAQLRRHFRLLKVGYDEAQRNVIWLAEARRGFGSLGGEVPLRVRFYDGDDARLYDTRPDFQPNFDVRTGERFRIVVDLPAEEVRDRVRRVLMLRPEDKVFPEHPGPQYKPGGGKPEGKIAWDTAALQKYLKVLRVRYDEKRKHVIWLAEARRHFGSIAGDAQLRVRFYDAGGTRVYDTRPDFQPNFDVRKGERLYVWVDLPAEEVLDKTKKVVLEKP
jgi:hypothetical protein